MDYEFTSQEDLYKRVEPALKSKVRELKKLGYTDISKRVLWNILIDYKWKNGKNITLSDIVDDILNTPVIEINSYYKEMATNKNEEIL